MSILANKKIIIIGDRDGVPGQAIEECVKTELLLKSCTLLQSALSERLQAQWIWKTKIE